MDTHKDEKIFKKECKTIRLKHEYPGYSGDIPWLIVSNLTVDEIHIKYENEIKPYSPFIHMPSVLFGPIRKSHSNDKKHLDRANRWGDAYTYVDGEFEVFHPEIIYDPFEQPDWSFLYDAIDSLPTNMKRRIHKKYFLEMSITEIALQEGVTKQAVSKSINNAIQLLRNALFTL